MPAGFEKCVSAGGRVRTKKISGGGYMHICFKNGKSYAGEVKTAKKQSKKSAAKKGGDRTKKIALFKKKR